MSSMYQRIEKYVHLLYDAKVPYTGWNGEEWKEGDPPFYYGTTLPPPIEFIKEHGCCCAGFINLVCRQVGARIPKSHNDDYDGGMEEWTYQVAWIPIIRNETVIPNYSLVMMPFGSEHEKEGHIGICIDEVVYHSMGGKGITTEDYPWDYYCLPTSYLR